MPDMDGYSLMRSIRMLNDPEKSEVSAVALTAYARSSISRPIAGFSTA
jgi:CheY-like chemotaxis protein